MQKELESRRDIDGVAVWCGFDEILPIAKLKPHPKTNNSHPPKQLELLPKIIITGWRMELDPVYCGVIVQRWEEFTEKKATRA